MEQYEMTLAQWRARIEEMGEKNNSQTDGWHRQCVEQALYDGNTVPDEVLNDYPNIGAVNSIFEIDNSPASA